MLKTRITAVILIILAALVGYFSFKSGAFPYHLGLDLSGGSHLVYHADVSAVAPTDIDDAMNALSADITHRINVFGVSEPIVQTETGGTVGNTDYRLIVELPGVTDLTQAEAMIGRTPQLVFMLVGSSTSATALSASTTIATSSSASLIATGLTGALVKSASVQYDPTTYQPYVSLIWNDQGAKLFDQVTKNNVGQRLAIFLDGALASAPTIQEEISGGNAQITGNFTLAQAKSLVSDLNLGALPLPITLISTQTIGATLGSSALDASIIAGIFAFIIISLFLIIWYRLPGLVASIALIIYTALNLAIYKLIPVTLTSAGIAGFILSIGMAVDANILIFERTKEELARGRALPDAIKEGFHRAWLSIRDSNLSSIITAIILYYFASTPIVQGFALVFLIGVLVSMFSAVTLTRTFLMALGVKGEGKMSRFLFGSGIKNK
jgi:preprotein translocase subunit SecD